MARDPIRFMHVIATVGSTKLNVRLSRAQRQHQSGGVTIGVMKSEQNHGTYRFAIAVCSANDQYSKKQGRRIVRGRMACARVHGKVSNLRGIVNADGFDDAFVKVLSLTRDCVDDGTITLPGIVQAQHLRMTLQTRIVAEMKRRDERKEKAACAR